MGERPLGGKLRGETVLLGESTDREKDGDGERLERRERREALGENSRDAQLSFHKPRRKSGFFLCAG